MAALVLSIAGGAAGSALFGPAGAIAGRILGAIGGSLIDQSLFGGGTVVQSREGPRLADLDVMASTEGSPIPRAYGRVRLSGQMIWATQLEEVVTTTTQTTGGGGKGGGGGQPQTQTTTITYSYYANVAIGLCEGPIACVTRIWADGKPLDLTGLTIRQYKGDDAQMPDPLIVAKQGDGEAPAYRGLAYVVFEALPLEAFGNRIPQLSFEVVRPVGELENRVRAVTIIPGATEFGYEPSAVVRVLGPGQSAPENRHVEYAESDFEASLDELQAICPHLERVALVVTWFGNDLRAGTCRLRPGIDDAAKETSPEIWSVAGLDRAGAHPVSQADGRSAYGGTPSDNAVMNAIADLKARGLKVTLYPFVMMDIPPDNVRTDPWTGEAGQPAYPWRGHITCNPAPGRDGSPDGTATAGTQVASFFGGGPDDWNYRNMILHYASLAAAAGGVDAFLIGSELRGLTRVRSASGVYPAVAALATLASDVKALLGEDTIVTYGADWTEYGAHVVDDMASEVRFPLDPLWASAAIDVIGIDYYPPLSDWRDTADHLDRTMATSIHARDYLQHNIAAGEAYDWYYADGSARASQTRTPITDGLGKPWIFRQKDLWNFWSRPHYERVGGVELASPTAFVPEGKPIWLTEFGCPAVDKGSNQPSVFPDRKSADGGYPHFSNGGRDDLIQRRLLESILAALDPEEGILNPESSVYDGRMFDPSGLYVWTWDARPYPVFPAALDHWSDGANWETGHWVTGRFGSAPLDALVAAILRDAGVTDFDSAALGDGPEGYVIDRPMTSRAAIEPLAGAFAFDAREEGDRLVFAPRGGAPVAEIAADDLLCPDQGAPLRLVRAQETELPREVSLGFTETGMDFRRAAVRSRRLAGGATRILHADIAAAMNASAAERRAEIWLQDLWAGRESAQFALPPSLLRLMPGDVIALHAEDRRWLLEIRETVDASARTIKARSIDPEVFGLPLAASRRRRPIEPPAVGPVHAVLLDLPTLGDDRRPVLGRIAIFSDPWPGPVALWRSGDGASFDRIALAVAPAVVGETLGVLNAGPGGRWDRANMVDVRLYGGALSSAADHLVLGGVNAAALRAPDGAWEIIQFAGAELIGERTYRLSRLLRGQAGSEWAIQSPLPPGAPFVLLDERVIPYARGLDWLDRPMQLRIVSARRDHGDVSAVALEAVPAATALRPLSPVHLRARRVSGGVLVSWVRRARSNADSWAAEDIPLDEPTERYRLDIYSGADPVRSFTVTEPQATYATADILADFGTMPSGFSVAVAQLSAIVGRGFAASATLTF